MDPGVKKAPDPGSGSATLDLAKWWIRFNRVKLHNIIKKLYPMFEVTHKVGLCTGTVLGGARRTAPWRHSTEQKAGP